MQGQVDPWHALEGTADIQLPLWLPLWAPSPASLPVEPHPALHQVTYIFISGHFQVYCASGNVILVSPARKERHHIE